MAAPVHGDLRARTPEVSHTQGVSTVLVVDDEPIVRDVVVRYLRAMDPGQAGKIIKEFKTPAEVQRVKGLMEQVRSAAESAGASAR